MKILKLAFIYKNHDTLRYVMFLYTKSQTLRKNKDNLRYVFMYPILMEFLKLAEGVGHFYMKKKHFPLHLYIRKQCTLRYVVIYKNTETLRYMFICKKQCTLRYV